MLLFQILQIKKIYQEYRDTELKQTLNHVSK